MRALLLSFLLLAQAGTAISDEFAVGIVWPRELMGPLNTAIEQQRGQFEQVRFETAEVEFGDCAQSIDAIFNFASRGITDIIAMPAQDCVVPVLKASRDVAAGSPSLVLVGVALSDDQAQEAGIRVAAIGALPPWLNINLTTLEGVSNEFSLNGEFRLRFGCAPLPAVAQICLDPAFNASDVVHSASRILVEWRGDQGTVETPYGQFSASSTVGILMAAPEIRFSGATLDDLSNSNPNIVKADLLSRIISLCPECSGTTDHCDPNKCPEKCNGKVCDKRNGQNCCTVNGMPTPEN